MAQPVEPDFVPAVHSSHDVDAKPTPLTTFGKFRAVLNTTVDQWFAHKTARKGAALAYYTLFSIAPILILVMSIAGFFLGPKAVQGGLFSELINLVGPSSAAAIEALLTSVTLSDQGVVATVTAIILLLVGATTVFAELKDGLDEIWHEDKKPGAGLWNLIRTRVLSFGMVLTLSFLLMVSLLISTALDAVGHMWIAWWPHAMLVVKPIASVFSFVVISTLFASIFKLLPQATIQWKDVALGSFSTSGLFYVGKFVIGVYLGNSHVTSGYGAAGSIVALILWVYYSAQIFFLGAEFTHQHALMFGSLRKPELR